MYTLKLNDGTELDGLTLKAGMLMSDKELTRGMFAGKLAPVSITFTEDGNDDEDFSGLAGDHDAMEVCYIKTVDGKYALALADIDPVIWQGLRNEANIQYVAMMSGIEL